MRETDLYSAADRLPYNSGITGKTLALAADYFKAGKTVEWVIDNVCGKKRDVRLNVITLAEQIGRINKEQSKAIRSKYGLIKKG